MDMSTESVALQTPFAYSILLPLLLMSVQKQRFTPEPKQKFSNEYDFIVVGAGGAGSVVASRLTELSCIRVLLLEAGLKPPSVSEVPAAGRWIRGGLIDWSFTTEPQKNTGNGMYDRRVPWSAGKVIGGSSIITSLPYVRGNKKNYDMWAEQGAKGWSYKDVKPYFIKSEDNQDPLYLKNGYHGDKGPVTVMKTPYKGEVKEPIRRAAEAIGYQFVDPNNGRQTGFYDEQGFLRGGQRCSTAKAYLVPAENRTNLDIVGNAFVREVVISNGIATGVRFDYKGVTHTVKAKREVILSAGAVNTAKLLLLSGIGPEAELKNLSINVKADLPVGKNLQDHIAGYTFFQVANLSKGSTKLSDRDNIMEYVNNRTGPLTAIDFDAVLAFLKNGGVINSTDDYPDHQLYFAEAEGSLFARLNLNQTVLEQLFGPYENEGILLGISQLLHPKSRGTITLKSKDPYDPPVIQPNYLSYPEDFTDIVDGMKDCMRIATHPIAQQAGIVPFNTTVPGCEKFVSNMTEYFKCVVESFVVSFYDYVGTARMGDPKNSSTVVDPQLRVLGIKGLRVIDASVMPIIPSGNALAPTIMVAEKGSYIIKQTIDCKSNNGGQDSSTESSNDKHCILGLCL